MSIPNEFTYQDDKIAGNPVHILRIALRANPKFITKLLPGLRPSEYVKAVGATYAINADQFHYHGETPYTDGFHSYMGTIFNYSRSEPILYISKNNDLSFVAPKNIYTAVSGNHILLNKGTLIQPDEGFIFPRTAIGWNAKFMFWVVVDGIESNGTGMSLAALSFVMKSLGCQYALNMDGGGSSVMVRRNTDNTVSILSTPSDDNIPGHERPVASCLAVV